MQQQGYFIAPLPDIDLLHASPAMDTELQAQEHIGAVLRHFAYAAAAAGNEMGAGRAIEGLRSLVLLEKTRNRRGRPSPRHGLSPVAGVVLSMASATDRVSVDEIAGGLKLAVAALPVQTMRPVVESALCELEEHGLSTREADGRHSIAGPSQPPRPLRTARLDS